MLVVDLDKRGNFKPDGTIDQSQEFVFSLWAPGSKTDMDALCAAFDTNRDHFLTSEDKNFSSFRIWIDSDEDAVSDPGEVRTLAELGILAIPLKNNGGRWHFSDGSRIDGTNVILKSDGQTVRAADVAFSVGRQNLSFITTQTGVDVDLGDGTTYRLYNGKGDRNLAIKTWQARLSSLARGNQGPQQVGCVLSS